MVKRRSLGDVLTLAGIVALLGATYFLPPDTSLQRVRERGALRVCVPDEYPPLVTDEPGRPGVDVEIVQAIADHLDVELQLVRNDAIGRDFNPRSWRITRAQCALIAGGVITTGITRSFLETTPPHLETGWAALTTSSGGASPLDGAEVGFLAGTSGLDRIALSRFLRRAGASVTLLSDEDEALRALENGRIDALVTEGLRARQVAAQHGWHVRFLGDGLERYPVGFGLWKGDLTLKRAVVAALRDLEREGTIRAVLSRYDLAPTG